MGKKTKELHYDVDYVKFIVNRTDDAKIRAFLTDAHPADLADIFEDLDQDEKDKIVQLLAPIVLVKGWKYFKISTKKSIVNILSDSQILEIYQSYREDLLSILDEEQHKDILNKLHAQTEHHFPNKHILEEQINAIIVQHILKCPYYWSVQDTKQWLKQQNATVTTPHDYIFLTDDNHITYGYVHMYDILVKPDDVLLSEISHDIRCIREGANQEDIINLFVKYRYYVVAVTYNKQLIGAVFAADVWQLIAISYEQDILDIGGAQDADLWEPMLETCFSRIRWLSTTMISAVCIILLLGAWNQLVKSMMILASMIPIIASFSGNAGIQSAAVVISSINAQDIRPELIARVILRETMINFINGLAFGIIISIITVILFGLSIVNIVVLFAMPINMAMAGLLGSTIPFIMRRFGYNPAAGAGPVLTTCVDIMSNIHIFLWAIMLI